MVEQVVNIPCLDLKNYTDGTVKQKRQFVAELGKAFTDTGFITITNHGMNKELINQLYVAVEKFFTLSDEVKAKYEVPGLAGQRGYTSKGKETAKNAKVPDLKEFWQRGQTVYDEDPIRDEFPENVPVDLPDFDEITEEVYHSLESAGRALLKAIAVFLGLEEDYFEAEVHNGNSILRAIHYFPILQPELLAPDAVRAAAHEDINLITLLIGASADGLEVLTRSGKWFPIKAHGEDIVVNVGDMLQRLTNNRLKSTTHRVVNPSEELMSNSRYSVPFFLHPKPGMDLSALEQCVDAENPKVYPDITAGAYLNERLKEIGLKM